MKLFASFSEAIREGAKLRPQSFRQMYRDGSTCAIGAGYEAMTGGLEGVSAAVPELEYPYLKEPSTCPVSQCQDEDAVDMTDVIIHLNDSHRWSRADIADWLEKEEEKLGYVTLTERAESEPRTHNVTNAVECPMVAQKGIR